MPCHVLCPGCGNDIGEMYEFIKFAKQGYYKSINETKTVCPTKLDICPDITKPIGFILDAAGIKMLCCRMHIMGVTNFDNIYT